MTTAFSQPAKFIRALRRIYFDLFIFLSPRREITMKTLNGVFTFDSKDRYIGKGLFVRKHFEFDMMTTFMAKLDELGLREPQGGGAVLDVGGNIGMSSIALLREGYFKTGVAFEPSPENFRLMIHNIEQNGLSGRLIGHHVALSDVNGVMELELNPKNIGDNRIRPKGEVKPGNKKYREDLWKTIKVPTRKLDDFLEEGIGVPVEDIRLVWMDIQGHEGEFFKGARGFFQSYPGVPVVTEFWPYALSRSSVGRGEFCSLVGGLFSHFLPLEDLEGAPRPIAGLDAHFDRYGSLFTQMLFFNR